MECWACPKCSLKMMSPVNFEAPQMCNVFFKFPTSISFPVPLPPSPACPFFCFVQYFLGGAIFFLQFSSVKLEVMLSDVSPSINGEIHVDKTVVNKKTSSRPRARVAPVFFYYYYCYLAQPPVVVVVCFLLFFPQMCVRETLWGIYNVLYVAQQLRRKWIVFFIINMIRLYFVQKLCRMCMDFSSTIDPLTKTLWFFFFFIRILSFFSSLNSHNDVAGGGGSHLNRNLFGRVGSCNQ